MTLPIKWTLLELDHLIPETMWENLNVLLLSNIKVSSDFLYSVRKKGKALLYLDFELDTTLDSWKRLLNDLLDLNLLGLGIRIVAERDWMPEDEYRFAMAEKAVSSERLIKQTGLLKTWVSVLDSNMSWCREDVEADWVRAEESVPMWFFRA
ncbi:hypothetical protein FRC03_007892 [Tulasnella sp. 419]|nr:hypothetical protein FRC03_007892 [Tulasnella sp. 419]